MSRFGSPATLWILEDNEVFLKHLRRLLRSEPDFNVTETFTRPRDMLDKLSMRTTDLPDVLLLDIGLPEMSGLQVLDEIRPRFPSIQTLMLTSFDDRDNIYRALCNGAAGYLLKTADPDEILRGIRDAIAGVSPLSGEVAKTIVEGFSRHGPLKEAEPLTVREEEVLRHLVRGCIKKEIAETLEISSHTVDMHLRAVYRKLRVRNQTEAVSQALRRGLV